MEGKGNAFTGFKSGYSYDRLAALVGMGELYYQRAVDKFLLPEKAQVLELGCGTGSLIVALAKQECPNASFYGIDISEEQLAYARQKSQKVAAKFHFLNASMDELPFEEGFFDAVITSLALHETPSQVRQGAIGETARVLKSGGKFLLLEWSRPQAGLLGMLWLPFLFWGQWRDNWENRYCDWCEANGLVQEEDGYLNSLVRRQVFRKK